MKILGIEHDQAIAVLMYHSIDDGRSVISTSPRIFAEQMRVLSELDADVVSLDELVQKANEGRDARPMIAITFDDGFRNLYEQAFPVLQCYRFPATVFLVTDYCGGMNSWPSQPAGIPRQPLLSWDQIKEMSRAGIAFGSHTRSHPFLTALSERVAEEEMIDSKRTIEDAIGVAVQAFAYPYGAYSDAVKELVQTHFRLAFSTALGFVRPESDPYALERLDMYYFRRVGLFRRLFWPAVDGYVRMRRVMRELRARIAVVA